MKRQHIFAENPNRKKLKLDDVEIEKDIETILQLKEPHCKYSDGALTVDYGYTYNAVTLDCAERFADYIKRISLKRFILQGNYLLRDSALQTILLALKDCHALTHLEIAHVIPGDSGIDDITELLEENASIIHLKLVDFKLGPAGACALVQALAKNNTLQSLEIHQGKIGDNLEKFAKALGNNRSLIALNLNSNRISNKGALHLATHLKKNSTLTSLCFGNMYEANIHIGQDGRAALEKLFKQNVWMDKILIDYEQCLQRTSAEKAAQIESQTAAQSNIGFKITLDLIKRLIQLDMANVPVKKYLCNFENVTSDYVLSYADLYQLINAIYLSVQCENILFLSHPILKELFKEPYFLENFICLRQLSLITDSNFKIFYLLSSKEKTVLYELLSETPMTDNIPVSIEQINFLKNLVPHSNQSLCDLLNKITMENLVLSREDLRSLLSLSIKNIERLYGVIGDLSTAHLLTKESYQLALKRVINKQPAVIMSTLKEKTVHLGVAQKTLCNTSMYGSLIFFVSKGQDKNTLYGGYGVVKKAYTKQNVSNDMPAYSVKKISRITDGRARGKEEVLAQHNVKYNRLLDREAYFYKQKNGQFKSIATWQSGKSLNQFEAAELKMVPPLIRLQCVVNGLFQLNVLHSYFRIHGDIADRNVVMDFTKCQMALIDFDFARKKDSRLGMLLYGDKEIDDVPYDFCKDVVEMANVILKLFPETNVEKPVTIIDYVIAKLHSAMVRRNTQERCTSENALHFCQKILALTDACVDVDHLDGNQIDKIANETITSDQISIEDTLRGKCR